MRELAATMIHTDGVFPKGPVAAEAELGAAAQMRLGALRRGARGTIAAIAPAATRSADAIDAAELERRLLEMGFVEGARFEVLHEGPIGGDPIVVKLDETRIALRRRDANALIVETDEDRRRS